MNSSKIREQLRKKLDSIMGSEQRKQFSSIAGQEVPTYQVTCTEAILPGSPGKARGRQIEYGEFDAVFDIYDLHYQNCILPHERFEISFDQERGEYYPLGSRGLFRQVKASADGTICTNVPCLIQTEGQAFSEVVGEETCRVKLYETAISVWATRPIVEDEIFWVTYQPDRDKPLDLQSGVQAANGRWIPITDPIEREFLEFTCGRPYGNFTHTKSQGTNNPGVNNIFPLWDIIKSDDRIVTGGNFSNMAFGEVAGEESQGKENFGNTTDLSGSVWKLFKFDQLKSVDFVTQSNNTGTHNITQNDVYGFQFQKRGLYLCHVEFDVMHGFICLDGDLTNRDKFPKIGIVNGSLEVESVRYLFESLRNTMTNSFLLMSDQGLYLRHIKFITHHQERRNYILDGQSAVNIAATLFEHRSRVNFDFHFYITEEEVGTVMVNQLNMFQYVPYGWYVHDYPEFKHNHNPYIFNTNSYKGESLMEFVDVELEDVGTIVPVRNGTDVQNNPGPGGAGDELENPNPN